MIRVRNSNSMMAFLKWEFFWAALGSAADGNRTGVQLSLAEALLVTVP